MPPESLREQDLAPSDGNGTDAGIGREQRWPIRRLVAETLTFGARSTATPQSRLLTMNALASSWGTDSCEDCRVVWFDLSF